jgi:two-component system LytT family sensor kinase
MKKLIALFLIFLAIPLITVTDSARDYKYYNENLPDLPKDEKWEYVKDRIFYNLQNGEIQKFSGPILCELYDATAQDSLIVNNLFKELRILLPNKEIDHFKSFVGSNVNKAASKDSIRGYSYSLLENTKIKMYFNKENSDCETTYFGNGNRSTRCMEGTFWDQNKCLGVLNPRIYFLFTNNSTEDDRAKYIQYQFIRMIAVRDYYIPPRGNSYKAVNSIFNVEKYNQIHLEFTKLDKFLLQKLYSENLNKEFKTYLYKTYPFNYALNYLDRDKAKIFATWITFVLAICIFIIGFSLVYNKKYKYRYLGYFVPVVMISLYVNSLDVLYEYLTRPDSFMTLKRYVAGQITVVVLAALVSFLLFMFDKYFAKKNLDFTLQVLLKMSVTFLICIVPFYLYYKSSDRSYTWVSLNPILILGAVLALGRGVLLYLDHFSDSLVKEKDVELSRLKEAKAQAEVKVLQSQINPHFLYNSLNSIASLAHTDADKTEKMALSLSDLFRYTINRKGGKESTLNDELNLVRSYLEIEQIRFGDRLKFTIEVESDLLSVEVPMFILQPLVENAIKHGVSKNEGQGEIRVKIIKKGKGIFISVLDNGPDFPEGLVSGHGLQSVYDLLRLSYGDKAEMNWHNEPQKEITIYINDILQGS